MVTKTKSYLAAHPKLFIFFIALTLRLILGWIFYGGADINSFLGITQLILNKEWLLHPVWCYFPTICFHLWWCGWLCIATPLPSAFCIKLVPILFDALLAVLVYDVVKVTKPHRALRTGFLYALCPVALIVACIHGQWDAYVLLLLALSFYLRDNFQDAYLKYATFGFLFALSFLIKPYTLLFSFFFFTPYHNFTHEMGKAWHYLKIATAALAGTAIASFLLFKMNRSLTIHQLMASLLTARFILALVIITIAAIIFFYRQRPWRHLSGNLQQWYRYQAAAVAGACSITLFCFLCFAHYNFSIAAVIDTILRYSNQAAPTLGLPFAYPIVASPLFLFLKNRLWVLLVIGGIAGLYYQAKISVLKAITASFALVLGFNGLVPSYFVFLPPFLLMIELYKLSALYSLAASAFYLLYYANPLANAKFPYESILGYVPLTTWHWLIPPQWLTDAYWVPLIRFLSNYLLPCICIGIFIYLVHTAWRQKPTPPTQTLLPPMPFWNNAYLWIHCIFTLVIAACHLLVQQQDLGPAFQASVQEKLLWYDITTIPNYVTGAFPLSAPYNILFILGTLALIWSIVAYKTAE